MHLLKNYLLCFLLLICLSTAAQQRSLYFNHLTVNNGLSQGVNNCIYKDSRGYVWISSFDGLNRYDGLACNIYRENSADSNAIRGTLFLNILEDVSGNLWIGSNKGLNCYNRAANKFINYQMPGRKTDDQIFSPFYIDENDRIWFQSGSDIIRFDVTQKKFTLLYHFTITGNLIIKTFPAVPYKKLQQLFAIVDKAPQIYVGTPLLDALQWNVISSSSTYKNFNCILPVSSGLWIGTNKGLLYYTHTQFSGIINTLDKKPIEDIQSLCIDKKGMLWAGTLRDGLYAFDTSLKKAVAQYTFSSRDPYSLSGNQVQYLFNDNENHLWAAVWGKGVDYVSLEKFRFSHHLTKEEAENIGINNFIKSIVQVDATQFWCGTQSNGIIILDKEKKVSGVLTKGLPPAIEHLYKDSKGNIWVATFSGLYVIHPNTKKITPLNFSGAPNNSTQNQFNFITEITSGIMLASSNNGIYLIKEQNHHYIISILKGLPDKDVYLTSFKDDDGNLYISRAFKGFITGTLINDSFIVKKDFSYQATIKCFYEADATTLYIGSTIGLMKFNKINNAVEKIYTTADGLSNQYIYGVLPDSNALWLSTNSGINRLQLSDESVKSFSAGDGLQSNEFNTYSFCKAYNGELLFGGVNGLNSFLPAAITPYPYTPQLQMSSLQINDVQATEIQNAGELKKLILDPDENTVSFQFTVLDFANPEANLLYYMLEGYDKNWITAANKSVIRYANLPPGNYTLMARAVNAEKKESNSIYKLTVVVKTPWWQTWWFRSLLFIFIVGVVFFIIKNYLAHQFQKQKVMIEKELAIEQERSRMARELHDGLGSMLSGIKHSFAAMNNELILNEDQQLKFHSNIDKLNESIKELRNISHSMASESLLKYGLENSLKDYCRNISEPGNIAVSFAALHTEQMQLSEEQIFHIFRIIQELLQNIIKHSGAANAIVQISYNEKRLYIAVEDNGVGFDQEQVKLKTGIGLKNIEARVKLLKGKIDFQATSGTSVLIEIPCAEKK